jgi:hypothetical protein
MTSAANVRAAEACAWHALNDEALRAALRVEPVGWVHCKLLLLFAVTIVVAMELFKRWRRGAG